MSDLEVMPELKEIVGALLFVAKTPITAGDMVRVMKLVAENWGGPTKDFAKVKEEDVKAALDQIRADLAEKKTGITIAEVAHGFRFENEVTCGPWVRQLLEKGRPTRLSRPALETLAIIAYRQPSTRSEIEAVRGVAVDQIIRNLLEMQLVKIVGRSELPGRPWLFGTTSKFLEHFGLKAVGDLPGVEELRRMETAQIRKAEAEAVVEGAAGDEGEAKAETEGGVDAAAEEKLEEKPESDEDSSAADKVADDERAAGEEDAEEEYDEDDEDDDEDEEDEDE